MQRRPYKLISHIAILFCSTTLVAQIPEETDDAMSLAVPPTEASVISIDLNDANDGWDDEHSAVSEEETVDLSQEDQVDVVQEGIVQEDSYQQSEYEHHSQVESEQNDLVTAEHTEAFEVQLPGEEVNFKIKLHTSTHHLVNGKAQSDIGKILFKSRLMPSNEVKLSLKLKQKEVDDVELVAYFDLANFTMELDGSNSVLNKEHKQVLKLVATHLKDKFQRQYQDYDYPEHVLMLVQMLGYWSVSPDGFVHEKRTIVSQ